MKRLRRSPCAGSVGAVEIAHRSAENLSRGQPRQPDRTGNRPKRWVLGAGDQGPVSRSVFGSRGRPGRSQKPADLRIGRAGDQVEQAGRSSDRESGEATVEQAGRPPGRRSGTARLSKLVGLRAGGAAQPPVGSADRSSDRLGSATSGRASAAGLRVREAEPDRCRTSRPVLGPAGRFDKTWGPVISYMTGPHTYVQAQLCPVPAQPPVATRRIVSPTTRRPAAPPEGPAGRVLLR
jgi:hypothetical protein